MNIYVCDAIMGSGKSSAAINHMNEMNNGQERKFIYITPFLDEAARIKNACPTLDFQEPSDKLKEYNFSKTQHAKALIEQGENITSTHSLFSRFDTAMIEAIREHEYSLIIDEDVECMTRCDLLYPDDLNMLISCGYAERIGDEIRFKNCSGYTGMFKSIMEKAEDRRLIDVCPEIKNGPQGLFYWVYPKEILEAFSEVYILTYMFGAQTLRWYLDMNDLKYKYIHTELCDGKYYFSTEKMYEPFFIPYIKELINISGTERMNKIGDGRYALSSSWFQRAVSGGESDEIKTLKRNIANFFNELMVKTPTADRMWTTYEVGKSFVRGKGYTRSDTAFNIRATNELRNKRALAYCVNVFMNPFEKNYLTSRGVEVDEDAYALSSMVQWIWRSAIRDGHEIWLYIPSSRMRGLLIDWMDKLAKGGATV